VQKHVLTTLRVKRYSLFVCLSVCFITLQISNTFIFTLVIDRFVFKTPFIV